MTSFVSVKVSNGKEVMAGRAEFFTVDNNRFSNMTSNMFGLSDYFKIFNSIIKSISVNMVDYLNRKWFKFSTKKLFHDNSMLSNLFTIYCNKFVTMKDLSLSFRSLFSYVRTSVIVKTVIMFRTISFGYNHIITINGSTVHRLIIV